MNRVGASWAGNWPGTHDQHIDRRTRPGRGAGRRRDAGIARPDSVQVELHRVVPVAPRRMDGRSMKDQDARSQPRRLSPVDRRRDPCYGGATADRGHRGRPGGPPPRLPGRPLEGWHMESRLIVLSNRIPMENTEPAGGLVFALHECLTQQGGVWIGSADTAMDTPRDALTVVGEGAYTRKTFDVTEEDQRDFYLGYANGVLWPLFHRRADLIAVEPHYSEAYQRINARVARLIAAELRPDDLLWVHDYHFLPVAHELRMLGVANRIGYFLHTPFPLAANIPALPERDAFPEWLAAYDLVGVQTERDLAALHEYFRGDPAATIGDTGTIRTADGAFRAIALPIGIDTEAFVRLAAASDGAERLRLDPTERLIVGVDRLDYSKGLVQKFHAFAAFLDRRSATASRVTLLQIAPSSRGALDAYRDIRTELEAAAGAINGTHAEIDWTPIRYICRNVARDRLAGLYRRADIGLVTPLADGMNLVAKEYVAAQNPDDPGVLILSHFAGAAEQMGGALLVNPYDEAEMAEAIARGLAMPRDERRARHAEMLAGLRAHDIAWWTHSYLAELSGGGAAEPAAAGQGAGSAA
jgi:trehalose 6-phosphate synthase